MAGFSASRRWRICSASVLLLQIHRTLAETALPGHSVDKVPDVNQLAQMWHLSGTVMPSYRSLILSPGVADRIGTVFNRYPLKTNDFEVSFTFSAKKNASSSAQMENDGFAFWYVRENASSAIDNASSQHTHNQEKLISGSWQNDYTKDGYGLLGYKYNYNGLGVFFLNTKDGKTVSLKTNDGSMTPEVGNGLPDKNQHQLDYQNGEDHAVKIRVTPEKIEVTVGNLGPLQVATRSEPGGYIGISCRGADHDPSRDTHERSANLELKGLKLTNFAAGPGEEVVAQAEPAKVLTDAEKEEILSAHSSFKDHRDESEAIKELTNMVFKLIVETKPMQSQMAQALDTLSSRITKVEHSFGMLRAEIDKKTGHKLVAEFEAIKKDLADIQGFASKDTTDRGKKLESLHADIEHVHRTAASNNDIAGSLDNLQDSSSKVLEQLQGEHKRMFGISIVAIAFILIAGLSLYNKFRCWEKKHVL